MASALLRKIYRGWDRHESYWDDVGMDQNLRTIGDHLPLNVKFVTGPKPASASEGECWIEPGTGNYAVWSTGNKLQPAAWNNYSPAAGQLGYCATDGRLYVNTGSAWQTLSASDKYLLGFNSYNAATNTLVVNMSDGTTVGLDLTALIEDAINSIPDAFE